jgi:hypothetical protein
MWRSVDGLAVSNVCFLQALPCFGDCDFAQASRKLKDAVFEILGRMKVMSEFAAIEQDLLRFQDGMAFLRDCNPQVLMSLPWCNVSGCDGDQGQIR